MVQLITTVIAIALAAAVALATVRYLPWWAQSVGDIETSIRASVRKLETVYIAAARTSSLAALAPNADADGGLMSLYGGLLGFAPGAPRGYTWAYGQHDGTGFYANMHYFCMVPTSLSAPRDEVVARALQRAANGFSAEQFLPAPTCGASTPEDVSTAAPVLTLYVKPLPDVGL